MRGILSLLLICILVCCEATYKISPPSSILTPHAFPSIGWVRSANNTLKCGVVLVTPTIALSAASCGILRSDVVVFGDHNRSDTDGNEQVIPIANVGGNALYDPITYYYDLIGVFLSSSVVINEYVKPIPILRTTNRHFERVLGKRCLVIGWGYKVDGSNVDLSDQSDVPRVTKVQLNETCTDVPESLRCFSPAKNHASLPCEGDAGGGYFCRYRKEWHFSGVVSSWNMGKGCQAGPRAMWIGALGV